MRIILFLCFILFTSAASADELEILLRDYWIKDIAFEGNYVWCATQENGLVQYNKKTGSVHTITTEDGLHSNEVSCIAVDKQGRKWLDARLLTCYDGNTLTQYTSKDIGLCDMSVLISPSKIAVDEQGVIWFAAFLGFFYYDGEWHVVDKNVFTDIFIDKEGIVWLGSYLTGRYVYKEGVFSFIRASAIDPDFDFQFGDCDSSGRQYWGNWRGFLVVDGDLVITFEDVDGIPLEVSDVKVGPDDIVWFGTPGRLWRYDGISIKCVVELEKIGNIYDIEIDSDGSVWFGGESFGGNAGPGILARYIPEKPNSVTTDTKPEALTLITASPNPFNASTTISFTLPAEQTASLTIYDAGGRKVSELVNGSLTAGMHRFVWDGTTGEGAAAASGVYFARLRAGDVTASGKMLLVK